jgi:hypothetical protein
LASIVQEKDLSEEHAMSSSKRRNLSQIALWARNNLEQLANNARDDDPPSILKALIPSLIECISEIDEPPDRGNQVQKLMNKSSEKYKGDCSLFEMCCYLIFRLDVWHIKAGKNSLRNDVYYETIVPHLLSLFQTLFKKSDLHSVLKNRLEIYGRLASENPEKIPLVYRQLMLRSAVSREPAIHRNMYATFPLIIADIMDEQAITIRFDAFNKIMLPICVNSISFYYDKLSESKESLHS